jgi:Flp pilus assembly protein TadD
MRVNRMLLLSLVLATSSAGAQESTAPVTDQILYLKQADVALRDGRLTQAGQMITWLERNGDRLAGDDVALLKAEYAIAKMDVAAAEAALSAITDGDRNICRLEPAKAWVAANRTKFDDAIVALAKATRSCPDDASVWNLLGLVFIRKGETAAASDAFARALAHAPEQAEIRNNYAIALLQKGDLALANQQLSIAARNAPANKTILANLDFVSGMNGEAPRRHPMDNDAEWSARLISVATGAKLAARNEQATALFSQALLTLDHFNKDVWAEVSTPQEKQP